MKYNNQSHYTSRRSDGIFEKVDVKIIDNGQKTMSLLHLIFEEFLVRIPVQKISLIRVENIEEKIIYKLSDV